MASEMTEQNPAPETFGQFKDSFAYGSRSDLLFKFLRTVPEAEAGRFFQELLARLGDTLDDGDSTRLAGHIYEWQVRGYTPRPGGQPQWQYDDAPFAPMAKPLSESRLALVASSGHFVEGHDPEPFGVRDMTQAEAMGRIGEFLRVAPVLSEVPFDTPAEDLRVRHGGYDVRAAAKDRNCQFPIDRLNELADAGVIGDLSSPAYSFIGAAAQLRIQQETAPALVETLQAKGVDATLLVAA